jgi:rubrerythrin
MAHLKYLYFAKRARDAGAIDIAEIFEQNAADEAQQAFIHLDLMYPRTRKLTHHSQDMNAKVEIESKSMHKKQNYSGFYSKLKDVASETSNHAEVLNFQGRLEESKQQANDFKRFVESNAQHSAPMSISSARPYNAAWGDAIQ